MSTLKISYRLLILIAVAASIAVSVEAQSSLPPSPIPVAEATTQEALPPAPILPPMAPAPEVNPIPAAPNIPTAPVLPVMPAAVKNDRWLCKPTECEMGLGFAYLPYDAQYKPFVVETTGGYHFNEYISWEVYRFGFALGRYSSGLRDQVYGDLHRQLDGAAGVDVSSLRVLEDDSMKRLRFYIGSDAQVRLFKGTVDMSEKIHFKHEWYATLGTVYFDMKSSWQMGVDLGLRMKSYIDENWFIDLRANQEIGLANEKQQSIGIFGLGVGYKF